MPTASACDASQEARISCRNGQRRLLRCCFDGDPASADCGDGNTQHEAWGATKAVHQQCAGVRLPVMGELAAFAFLFFAPAPTASAVILAVLTWAGLLSQLALALWWLLELIRRELPSAVVSTAHSVEQTVQAPVSRAGTAGSSSADGGSSPAETQGSSAVSASPVRRTCPMCASSFWPYGTEEVCRSCSRPTKAV
jgi:hypothetical protein